MPKTQPLLSLNLRARENNVGRKRWLYDEIRLAIVERRFAPGMRLPSTRSVSEQFRLARGTVVGAFDQLVTEGYLESKVGLGTFVSRTIVESRDPLNRARSVRHKLIPAAISKRGQNYLNNPFPQLWTDRSATMFRLDLPALDAFPVKLWNRVAGRRLRNAAPKLLKQDDALGFRPLREAIAHDVAASRGIKCSADEVVITTGTQQSLNVIAHLVLDEGDKVWVEDPGYAAAACLFRAVGARVIGVPVDAEGIDWEAGVRSCPQAKLAYATPGCQFPLGITMSLRRRAAFLHWAQTSGSWIFEDDYDSQLQFSGRPLAALKSMDDGSNVIYSNSFNKVLFSSLRLGFLILPSVLIEPVAAARAVTDRFPSVLNQAVLCDFVTGGHLAQHTRRMRELYAERHAAFVHFVGKELDGLLTLSTSRPGLHAVGWLAPGIDELAASREAARDGIDSLPLSSLRIDHDNKHALVFGIAAAEPRLIRQGIRRLKQSLLRARSISRRAR
jgi:GntR family transcriptional regulator/MocR family aminotransferase